MDENQVNQNQEPQENNYQPVSQTPEPQAGAQFDFKACCDKFFYYLNFLTVLFDAFFAWLEKIPLQGLLKACDFFVEKTIPIIIILSGISFLIKSAICKEFQLYAFFGIAPFWVILFVLLIIVLSSVLVPKVLQLARSLMVNRWSMSVRPEILYLLKVLCVVGFFASFYFIFLDVKYLVYPPICLLALLTLSKPEIINIKVEVPKNAVEEVLALSLAVPSFFLAFLSPILWLVAFATFIGGMVPNYTFLFIGSILAPITVPILVYLLYIVVMFFIDLISILVNLLVRVEEIKKILEEKK